MAHRIKIEGGKLVVEFKGIEEIATLKKKLEFNLKNVVSVSTEPHHWIEGLRIAGVGLPGVIKEGSYIVSGKKVFFAMKHPENCVTIELKNEDYDAIVIEVDDKQKVAQEIKKLLAKK